MYVHEVHGTVDTVLNMSLESLQSCYGPEYVKACKYVDYPVMIGFVWDVSQSRYVEPGTAQGTKVVWDEMAEAYRKGVQEA